MRTKILLLFIIIISLSTGCIEDFNPIINDYIDIPVVEGAITNEPGPYIMRLSKSSMVYDPELIPITGAEIIISDDLNFEETLFELEPGIYATDPYGIRGEIGRKYRITINIDDRVYQSNFEELEEPTEIDSVYSKIEYKGNFEGLQFYIDTETVNNRSRQFLWTLIETYKYEADDYPLDYIYYSEDSIVSPPSEFVDMINLCWKTEKVFGIFTGSYKNVMEPKLKNLPLHYVDTETKRLYKRYSLFVNQYSISDDAYRYWTEIKEQNDESGSLYTKQPFQIAGNLTNINNPDDIILGFFMVAGVSQKRIFVDQPPLNFYFDVCEASADTYRRWLNAAHPSYPIYVKLVGGEYGKAGLACFDCRMEGGKTNKPDFWED